MSRFLTEKYNRLKPYTPGEQPQDKKYVKLNTNESPYPPSPEAIRLAEEELHSSMLYPDPDQTRLLSRLAETYGVNTDEIIVTNGSDEVLNFAFMAWCDENTPAVFPDITYGFYKVFADINNLPMVEIPLCPDFTVNPDDYIRQNGTVFIANPNAPTGIALSPREIERILASDRERIVVIDEAYVDFGAESCIPLIKKYDNLLVTGTFSKSRSMAGARLGFGIGSRELIGDLVRIKYSINPYNVNRASAAMGIGALLEKEYFEENCLKIKEARKYTENALGELGFEFTDSCANFIFARSDKIGGKELYLKLKDRGILVRHFSSPKICEYNRITVGTKAQMEAMLAEITLILKEKKL
jgi:histidinol-phosphate aminotransferase